MQGFLIALSGARREILDQCPTERIKFQSLGWAILITSAMATVSMWFALTSALGTNPLLAAPAALGWGLIIMGIDRWLVISIPTTGSRRWALALPRVFLAILLGSVISTPLVLRIFQSEINAQISVIKEQRASAFLAALERSQVGDQVSFWAKDVAGIESVIASGGKIAPNPASDPVVKALTRQRSSELALEQRYYRQWQCQLYGGAGCTLKGNGPLARASQRSYENAVAQVSTFSKEIQARERSLTATSAAASITRLAQAKAALPGAQQQLATAQTRLDQLRQNFDTTNNATNGLLIRLQALSKLTGDNFTLGAARFLLFLLFLVIECLPVTVKLLQRPGNYERILQVAAERELKEARGRYRMRPQPTRAAVTSFDAAKAANESLIDIWRTGPTKILDRPTSTIVDPPTDEVDEATNLDDSALRDMPDSRPNAGSAMPGGGIELSWSDGER
jgi:hypothetical protein